MQQHPSLRSLRIVALSFVTVMIGASIAIWALNQTWDEIDGGLARTGEWLTGAVGVVSIVAAVMWRSRVVERPVTAATLTTSFFITIAIAEASLLIGFVFTVVSSGTRPFLVGLGMFAIALTVILLSFGQIEVETDGTPSSLIR